MPDLLPIWRRGVDDAAKHLLRESARMQREGNHHLAHALAVAASHVADTPFPDDLAKADEARWDCATWGLPTERETGR